MSLSNFVLALVGPTASGKTKLSILLADKLNGEIISADSRQIYRCLNIGTAKPSPEDIRQTPHHFIDILNPDQDYNAAEYGQQARLKIVELFKRGKQPILVGGSGLYVRAVVDGFFEGPGKNPDIRAQLQEEVRRFGKDKIFEILRKVDPISAEKMDATKVRRVIRALEVYYATGIPVSHLQSAQSTAPPFEIVQFGLKWGRQMLYQRIEQRIDEMMKNGLIEEVRGLIAKGYAPGINALNTVGYKEAFVFLEGNISGDEMVDLIKRNTRRFAKRQLTWFRADKRIKWVAINEPTDWNEIAEYMLREFQNVKKNGFSPN